MENNCIARTIVTRLGMLVSGLREFIARKNGRR